VPEPAILVPEPAILVPEPATSGNLGSPEDASHDEVRGTAGFFAERFRGARLEARLTQQELAIRAGISVRAIGYIAIRCIEQGRTRCPSPESTRRLAEVMDLGANRPCTLRCVLNPERPTS
jgi:hypothetical protein